MDYHRPVPPEESRRIAQVFGALYLITFATSIPALWLYQPVLKDPAAYVAGAGHNNKILLGAFLELLLIISNIGTATVVFPLLKRANEICAISYVTARVMECTFILVGILTMVDRGHVAAEPVRRNQRDARLDRIHARRDQGLDVPAWPRLRGRDRQRIAARLPDVPI